MTGSDAFPTLAAMRTAHTELLRLYRDKGASPDLLQAADHFIGRGAATGAAIQGEDDRMGAQSLLDYWAAILSRADRAFPHATLAEFNEALAPELPDSVCPYVGLEPFGESNRRLFFGRDRVVSEMGSRLNKNPLLIVVGSLGSGKSSIVLGGLIPRLKAGLLPGSAQWRYFPPFVPSAHPMESFARAVGMPAAAVSTATAADIVRHLDAAGAPAVVVIDRLEEVFTVCEVPARRDDIAAAILGAIRSPRGHRVIATLRSDFEPQLAAVSQLREPFRDAEYRLPPLSASELRDAIVGPAEQVGLKFEDGLVDRLVKEILGEPAGLPLLQFTLLKLWGLRERNRITLEAYRKIGGGRQALARTADEVYDSLSGDDQLTLRAILLKMARPAPGKEVVTKPVRHSELYAVLARGSVDLVIERLKTARLVRAIADESGGEEHLEIAHEALLWNWPKLIEWLDEERVTMRRRLRLTGAAEIWRSHKNDPGALLRGTLLEEAKSYVDLTPLERSYVDASVAATEEAAAEKERARQREVEDALALATEQARRADEQARAAATLGRKNRWLIGLAVLAVVLLVVAATGWIFAEQARREAVRKQQTVEVLMSGQGVVVENPPPPATSPEPAGAAPPAVPTDLPKPAAEPDPPPPPAPVTAAPPSGALAAPVDAASIVSRVQVRALRRATGRQISGTELPAYAFSAWVDGPEEILNRIESVQYEFNHPTFRQKLQVGRDRRTGFRVGYTGWGCLSSVIVTLRLRDRSVTPPHIDFDMCQTIEAQELRK